MNAIDFEQLRFAGDRELQDVILADGELGERVRSGGYEQHRKTVRLRLLSTAVRVDPRMLPKLAESIDAIRARTRYERPIEAYVFQSSEINAFLTEGTNRTYLGLSSAVVDTFSERELEFVIGHELGHAVYQHLDAQLIGRAQDGTLQRRIRQRVLAWRRATEISADRCGLVCCGSIDAAASAMFRTLSGLSTPGLQICPRDFSEQWDHLLEEVIRAGAEDVWQLSHPFPPLRMRAMVLFWESDSDALPARAVAGRRRVADVDVEIVKLLATMSPVADKKTASGDLLLEDVLLWAGVALTYEGGARQPDRAAALAGMVSPEAMARASAQASDERRALELMKQSLTRRHKRLRALEINRILHAVLDVGYAGGTMPASAMATFYQVGQILGIEPRACDLVRERYEQRRP